MKDVITKMINDNFEQRRKQLGISYVKLSEITGISKSSLQHYFIDYCEIPVSKFIAIAQGLQLDPGEFLNDIAAKTFTMLSQEDKKEIINKLKNSQF